MSLQPAAAELACCCRTGSTFWAPSSLTMTKIKPCDLPNLAFLLTYDLILRLSLAGGCVFFFPLCSIYPPTLR